MDSLSLYESFCGNGPSVKKEEKYAQVDQMIACIYKEVFEPPFEMVRSPFLCKTADMLNRRKKKKTALAGERVLSVFDAYVILSGLREYIVNPSYRTITVQDHISEYLFCRDIVWGRYEKSEKQIALYMKKIQILAEEAKASYGKTHKPGENSGLAEKNKEFQKEQIQKWHQKQEEMSESLRAMQPDVQSLLERFLTFQDTIKENYILQSARQQMELYNLMADAYVYHKEKTEKSENEDYRNAVENYKEYMEMIADGLAAFGVEEVVSGPGTVFEGGIHETDAVHFSSKEAVITKSIRSGFRYGELVLQKEKVLI